MPSTWFQWHAQIVTAGARVLDLASGSGVHAIAAAGQGAEVVAVDADPESLKVAEAAASKANVTVKWVQADLTTDPVPDGPYDVVMVFSYLDRAQMPRFLDAVKPGGHFMLEAFLEQQRELGWGPTADEHLLKSGELWSLVEPFEIVLAREVLEVLDGRSRAVASVLAQRPLV